MRKFKIVLLFIFTFLFLPFYFLLCHADEPSIHGFLQSNYSTRITGKKLPNAKRQELIWGEERGQLKFSFYPTKSCVGFNVKADLFHDWVENDWDVELREGYIDYLMNWFDIRIGRQIITWGIGDLLFINDIFPKDWEAFYSGRPLEYLKMGVDAAKLGLYTDLVSLEFLTIPNFTPDDLPSTGRFFFFDPYPWITNRELDKVKRTLANTEYALRLYSSVGGFDISVYGYKGFYRSPGMKADNFNAPTTISHFYPELNVYGTSLQKNAFSGVVSLEYGYYDSGDDRAGKDAGVENSQSKFLVGYQKEFSGDLIIGLQYYGELMHQYKAFKDNLPPEFFKKKELHEYLTLRITKLFRYQTIKLSLFTFYSPDEEDFLIMPEASYNVTDNMLLILGMNLFVGVRDDTSFGQHDRNDNIYLTVKYSF